MKNSLKTGGRQQLSSEGAASGGATTAPLASPSTVQAPRAVREALSAAQVSLSPPNPEAILGHHLLAFSLSTSLKTSSRAGCRRHPKPGGEETNLTFPDPFGECPACFSERGQLVKSSFFFFKGGIFTWDRERGCRCPKKCREWRRVKETRKKEREGGKSLQALARN